MKKFMFLVMLIKLINISMNKNNFKSLRLSKNAQDNGIYIKS